MSDQWTTRWKLELSVKAKLPGVWALKSGGHLVRSRPTDPRTGKPVEIFRQLPDLNAKEAFAWLQAQVDEVKRAGTPQATKAPRWSDCALSLFETKMADGTISTSAGRKKWKQILVHLFKAPWANWYVDRVRHAHLVDWRNALPALRWRRRPKDPVQPYAPTTLNDWLNVARVVWTSAKHKFELAINPMEGVEDFSTDGHRTYTVEEPNSLTDAEVATWMAMFRQCYPQHYAMTFLGLVLGHRPSTLRPLRRNGPNADVLWDKGVLLVRRSNTTKDVVEDFTKTKRDLVLPLPPVVMAVLKWHVATCLTTEAQKASELLFPTDEGGFRSRSCLDKPFADVTRRVGLTKRITPRALRRTFQDLARSALLSGVATKAISGHATDAMRIHYSTAAEAEVLEGINAVAKKATGT